jgi:hypothetical protein
MAEVDWALKTVSIVMDLNRTLTTLKISSSVTKKTVSGSDLPYPENAIVRAICERVASLCFSVMV